MALQTGTRSSLQFVTPSSSVVAKSDLVYECPFECFEKYETKLELLAHIDSEHREEKKGKFNEILPAVVYRSDFCLDL